MRSNRLDAHLQLVCFWSHSSSRWPPQGIGKHKNIYNSVHFEDTVVKFDVVTAEHCPQHIHYGEQNINCPCGVMCTLSSASGAAFLGLSQNDNGSSSGVIVGTIFSAPLLRH